jgi:hypothetical protein
VHARRTLKGAGPSLGATKALVGAGSGVSVEDDAELAQAPIERAKTNDAARVIDVARARVTDPPERRLAAGADAADHCGERRLVASSTTCGPCEDLDPVVAEHVVLLVRERAVSAGIGDATVEVG